MESPSFATREFVFESLGEKAYVEVSSEDTLAKVRELILEELDSDQFPSGDDTDFGFKVNGIGISTKQESKKNAFALLDKGADVKLVERGTNNNNKRKGSPEAAAASSSHSDESNNNNNETNNNSDGSEAKRRKLNASANNVTPTTETKPSEESSENDDAASPVRATNLAALPNFSKERTINELDDDDRDHDTSSRNEAETTNSIAGMVNRRKSHDDDSDDDESMEEKDAGPREELPHPGMQVEDDGEDNEGMKLIYGSNDGAASKAAATSSLPSDLFDDDESMEEKDAGPREELPHPGMVSTGNIDGFWDGINYKNPIKSAKNNSYRPEDEEDDNDAFDVDFDNGEEEEDLPIVGVDTNNNGNNATLENDDDEAEADDDDDLQIVNADTNHHQKSNEAKEKSGDVLSKLESILHDNPLFCSDVRRNDWLQEIQELQDSQAPKTVFGVLGNTGVGKSSLLNALLDEADVLPTSGSRGCTAAVVEMVYHSELAAGTEEGGAPARTVPVYRGAVEFMTVEDWKKELKILVDECSTEEKTIYARPPDETRAQAAFAAWQKIEQVYGKDSMKEYHGKATEAVFWRLANNSRVRNLLTPTDPRKEYNVISVEVGEVTIGSEEALNFLKPASEMNRRKRNKRKKLAQEFRKRINSYVYRKGNGSEPQTWPLIRKVTLTGPWSVLNTGAVLVDLPGVRDSNAARAKVAQNYLQNCNQIAIVAPIKRAVDDGTAKELLGEQFKRRLLMDGQYGNVFFICTQTDDLEATETMRDHEDVAKQVEGRWEKMEELANSISMLENELNDFKQEEEDLTGKVEELTEQCKEAKADLKEARDEEADDETIDELKAVLATHKEALFQAKEVDKNWADENKHKMDKLQDKCSSLQKKLKAICANVRNEYSKSCLQEDFRNGLKALYNNDDDNDGDDGADGANNRPQNALPEDYNMDVFCISSNDYLKLMGIKSNNDGQANTFECQRDTQIPQLRSYVHQTTARFCETHANSFVEKTNDLLDRMKLLAADASSVPTGRGAYKMMSQFEAEMKTFEQKVKQVADSFKTSLEKKIKESLMPSLQKGAKSGQRVAMSTVVSWGSKNRRSKHERRPDKNGLYWSTYFAVLRRSGQYNSPSAGAVDFNQELCDPMEKEFSTDWQAVLDSTIKTLLNNAEKNITRECDEVTQRLASGFGESGMDSSRLTTLVTTAKRSSITALKASFQQMLSTAVESQRNLSRTLLPAVQKSMTTTYTNSLNVERGSGLFNRMKYAMTSYSQKAVDGMFFEAMNDLQNGVDELIIDLQRLIASSSEVVRKSMGNVFSICWDDQSGKAELMDPAMMKKVRDCRDALLPRFQDLCAIQVDACQLLGIEREEVELDVMGVETLDQSLERRLEEAKKNGDAFDLCDSDEEVPVVPKQRIKADPDRASASVARAPSSFMQEVIDLCDSDDDWEAPPPSGLSSARKQSQGVKSEML